MKNFLLILLVGLVPIMLKAQPDPTIIRDSRQAEAEKELNERMQKGKSNSSLGDAFIIGGIAALIWGTAHYANMLNDGSSSSNYSTPVVRKNSTRRSNLSALILEGGMVLFKEDLNENWKSPGRRLSGDAGLSIALTPMFGRTRFYIKGFYSSRGYLLDFNNEDVFVNSSIILNPEFEEYKLLEEGNIEMRYKNFGSGLIFRILLGENLFTDIGSGILFNRNSNLIFHEKEKQSETSFQYLEKGYELATNNIKNSTVNFKNDDFMSNLYYEIGLGLDEDDIFFRVFVRTYNMNLNSSDAFPFNGLEDLDINDKFYFESSISIGMKL